MLDREADLKNLYDKCYANKSNNNQFHSPNTVSKPRKKKIHKDSPHTLTKNRIKSNKKKTGRNIQSGVTNKKKKRVNAKPKKTAKKKNWSLNMTRMNLILKRI